MLTYYPAGAAATGAGMWALDKDKTMQQSPQSSLGKHDGEDTAMADAAKKAGVESHQEQSSPKPQEAKEPSQEPSKDSTKKESTAPKGKPNQVCVSPIAVVFVFSCGCP